MRILALNAHVDDVDFAAGGTVSKFIEQGHEVYYIVCTTEPLYPNEDLVGEYKLAMKTSGVNEYKTLSLTNKHLERDRQTILDVFNEFNDGLKPDIVLGPALHDFHQDHHTVYREMCRAFKTSSSILCYEIPYNYTSFSTQLFTRLEKRHIEKKFEVLQCYQSQAHKPYLSKERIFGLASVRGAQCNNDYAEAFEVVRWMM